MKKLDANTKQSPMYVGSPDDKEETLYSVPLRAEHDLIRSPKGLKFQSTGAKEAREQYNSQQ